MLRASSKQASDHQARVASHRNCYQTSPHKPVDPIPLGPATPDMSALCRYDYVMSMSRRVDTSQATNNLLAQLAALEPEAP